MINSSMTKFCNHSFRVSYFLSRKADFYFLGAELKRQGGRVLSCQGERVEEARVQGAVLQGGKSGFWILDFGFMISSSLKTGYKS